MPMPRLSASQLDRNCSGKPFHALAEGWPDAPGTGLGVLGAFLPARGCVFIEEIARLPRVSSSLSALDSVSELPRHQPEDGPSGLSFLISLSS